ncbi:hypothetical protein BH20ACT5_BH20ACT5_07760 [soil metagenome]
MSFIRSIAGIAATVLLVGLVSIPVPAAAAPLRTEELRLDTGSGADAAEIDVTVYLPGAATESEPAAAVIVAHGYGGSKEGSRTRATALARQGYVAVAYTARGFGDSTGDISFNHPDREIADARALIDLLAERPEVRQDAPGDPRVGFYGGSYGGSVGLLTAGYDDRVDAVWAGNTWSSLVSVLFPNAAGAPAAATLGSGAGVDDDGVFKKLWAASFFESGAVIDPEGGGEDADTGGGAEQDGCGRIRPEYCAAYEEVARTGRLSAEMRELLAASSPAAVLDQITAPTLLTQGQDDTLFPLWEADANARGIAANGTPVKIVWYTGGHGPRGPREEFQQRSELIKQWFDFYLNDTGPEPERSFGYYTTVEGEGEVEAESENGARPGPAATELESVEQYPGLDGSDPARLEVSIAGPVQKVLNPEGGTPTAVSTIPRGATTPDGGRRAVSTDIPGQTATFASAEFSEPMEIIGSPVASVRVASPTGEAVLFGKLFDVDPDGEPSLIQGLVAPLRLTGLPASLDQGDPVQITLPAITHTIEAGHQLQLALASTDAGYATPAESVVYEVALDGETGVLSIPDVTGESTAPPAASPVNEEQEPGSGPPRLFVLLAIAALALVLVAGLALAAARRRRRAAVEPDYRSDRYASRR